jgi:hypothetical protein
MPIKQLISGGSPGAESAALDVAHRLSMPYGGITFAGDQRPNGYGLVQKPLSSRLELALENMALADGMVILTHGRPRSDLERLSETCRDTGHPFCHIDFKGMGPFQGGVRIDHWATENAIQRLFVTGSSLAEDPLIIEKTEKSLLTALMLGSATIQNKETAPQGLSAFPRRPKTVAEAVSFLLEVIALKDRVIIANMTAVRLESLNMSLGKYIRGRFGLSGDNPQLVADCSRIAGRTILDPMDASAIIISILARELEKTHRLRKL